MMLRKKRRPGNRAPTQAEAARRNPWETPDAAEKRARHYEQQAERLSNNKGTE